MPRVGGLCPEWDLLVVDGNGDGMAGFGNCPSTLREAVLLGEGEKDGGGGKEESERWKGPGQRRSELSVARSGAGMEPPAGQKDARAEQGHEMFPPCPETGRSRNPTGNLAPMEPLTWPWYGVLQPCHPAGQVHPTGSVGDGVGGTAGDGVGGTAGTLLCPSPLPLPWGGRMGVPAEGRAKSMGPYLSGELSLGCSCPFSSRSPLVVFAPTAVSGLGVWLGFAARLELGVSVLGQ